MLVVIDMQNHILDPDSDHFVPGADRIVPKIAERIAVAHKNKESVLFTQDMPINYKDTKEEDNFEFQIIDRLGMKNSDIQIKKYYFSIPPETLIHIKEELFSSKKEEKQIELVGVETNLCVFSNALGLQSVFPEADLLVDPALVAAKSNHHNALQLLQQFNIKIKEDEIHAMEHE